MLRRSEMITPVALGNLWRSFWRSEYFLYILYITSVLKCEKLFQAMLNRLNVTLRNSFNVSQAWNCCLRGDTVRELDLYRLTLCESRTVRLLFYLWMLREEERWKENWEGTGRAKDSSYTRPICVYCCPIRGVISGAITSQYLLEKSRIVFQVGCFFSF